MKLPVLAALLLAVTCHAQTLKWTVPVPEFPEGAVNVGASQIRSDNAGNVLLVNFYTKDEGSHYQLVWVSSVGKLLHAAIVENANALRVLRVSGGSVLIQAEGAGNRFFRKYTRKGTVVTFVDTPIPFAALPSHGGDFEDINKNFFFLIEMEGVTIPKALHRYNR